MTSVGTGLNAIQLEAERITSSDPILKLLTRIEASPILVGVAYSLTSRLMHVVTIWRAGHLRTAGTVTGLLDDPATYTNAIFLAVLAAYYTWLPRGVARVFKELFDNGVIGMPIPSAQGKRGRECTLSSFMETMQTSFDRWWWSPLSLVVAIGVMFILVRPQYLVLSQGASWAADTHTLTIALTFMVINLYCVFLIVILSLLSIYWLTRLLNGFTINVRLLYPDQAGGLLPLGDFVISMSYLIALVGAMLVVTPVTRSYVAAGTWQFRWTTEILLGLGTYAVIVPIMFFAPLSLAHRAMKEAKHRLLLRIARRFEGEYANIQDALDYLTENTSDLDQALTMLGDLETLHDQNALSSPSGGIPGLEQSLKTLGQLQDLHNMTSEFPVWPFNVGDLARFGTSYLSPVVLAIIIDLLGGFISP